MPNLKPTSLFTALICICTAVSSQSISRFQKQALIVKRVIELNHYAPRPVDDTFSSLLYDQFINRLDEDHIYFSREDLHKLSVYRTRLDDELNGKGWNFLPEISGLFRKRLEAMDSTPVKNKSTAARHRAIRRILDNGAGYDKYIATLYCSALSNTFDPHTEYMPPAEKQQFESQLSTEGYYFGFSLDENSHREVEIARLTPGGPAWKCGDLNKGDVLVKITPEGRDPIDLSGSDAAEISGLIDGSGNNRLHITVRKTNGMEKTVTLNKEKIRNEENIVKAFVLQGENRIGYIYLPGFYTGLNGNEGSCANDVAKEIVKLKKENIEGLILDVRFNGGGSLQEALDMAGIFIDQGPLSLIRERAGRPVSLKDMNKGTIYDGPMLLLVNGQSASASELLGAVLQDYNRAVVAGCTTYGKGTAQVILPADTTGSMNNVQEYGYVKVTTSKFYRVSGRTTQNTGVVPDIRLPDLFDGLNYHESASPTALTADTVDRNPYYRPLSPLPLDQLAAKSGARIAVDKHFQTIKAYSKILSDTVIKEKPPLDLDLKKSALYATANNAFDKNRIKADAFLEETNGEWLARLDRDIYIQEGYCILHDLIISKKP